MAKHRLSVRIVVQRRHGPHVHITTQHVIVFQEGHQGPNHPGALSLHDLATNVLDVPEQTHLLHTPPAALAHDGGKLMKLRVLKQSIKNYLRIDVVRCLVLQDLSEVIDGNAKGSAKILFQAALQ